MRKLIDNLKTTETNMDKRSYDRSESVNIDGKPFHFTPDRKEFLSNLTSVFKDQTSFTKEDFDKVGGTPYWVKSARYNFKDNGVFNLATVLNGGGSNVVPITAPVIPQGQPVMAQAVPSNMPVAAATQTVNMNDNVKIIPEKMSNYVPFGHFKDVKNIIKSKIFFPVFITGLSGNGKTLMIEQTCAQLKRELFRVNITIETDEDDLMGGHTLVNGNVVFREGPVIKAMRKGAVLLLDEVDLGSNKLMCLQSVLEGKGYLIKKTGEWVSPKEGFTILATANTKGQGSDDGKFIGTQIMNEAMLERFAITMQQEYPPVTTERSILKKEMELSGAVDEEFCHKLVDWADIIRKTYYEGAIDDVVTTRRLVHIVNAYRMFEDKLKSITMCISRFDEETRNSILDLYSKIDAGVDLNAENSIDETESSEYND
jgi:MoxR-like ATPase